MPFDEISAKEFKPITLIFSRNGNEFYDCYKPYLCDKCNRFDWLKATQNGIQAVPKFPLRMPDIFITSYPNVFVVSVNTQKAIEMFSKNIADFFPIPGYKDYFVLLPKQLLFRPDKVKISDNYKHGEPFRSEDAMCKKCKKYPDLCYDRKLFMVPDDITFAGIVLDTKSMTLVASRELSEHLRQYKLKGISSL